MRSLASLMLLAVACAPPPQGLKAAEAGAGPQVKFDVFHLPLPEVPLPNDFASRFDATSPTLRRINAAIEVAPTTWEQHTRAELDGLSGWGTLAPITVSFSQPLDVNEVVRRHQVPTEVADDTLYVLDVTESSPDFCAPQLLDVGQGHFPTVLDRREYYPDDPHAAAAENTFFEQTEEDLNGNGVMDPGEDTDMDGVLDHPNSFSPTGGKFDVMGFYERETDTLIAKPLYPLREATTYAVVLTTRLKGVDGNPVRSPFSNINHLAQSKALAALPRCLGNLNLSLDDVAFTWSFTTQSITSDYKAVREGLYGTGPFAFLSGQFPAGLGTLETVRTKKGGVTNTKIVPGETFRAFGLQLFELMGTSSSEGTKKVLDDALRFVDFYASGSIVSPQFFPRNDSEGRALPLYDQVFDLNPAQGKAFTRPENVPFFMSTPVGRTGPAPVVIFVHGHTGSKLDSLLLMGPLARFGLATIGIDAVSHGIGLGKPEKDLVSSIVKPYGLEPLLDALFKGRALDQNGDGVVDPGVDYWTAYVIHTRDVVRQTAIDTMQLVRTLRSFDGVRTWAFDVNGDGQNDLAGDFDGDGKVDIGGPNVPIYLAGASLGGILASLIGGLEPEVDAIVPILPGGYLSEVGTRSDLGQVRDPMILRSVGPLMLVHPDAAGKPSLFQMLPDLGKGQELKVATLAAPLVPGRIAVVRNLKSGEWRCGRVQPTGHLRLAVSSDKGDPLQLDLYAGELPTREREGCDPGETTPEKTFTAFEAEFTFQSVKFPAGAPLIALGDGFGLKRGSPELRRFLNLAQVGLESADPANFAPYYEKTRTLSYADGSTVATRALMVPMTGDPGVPIAAGVALLRAAGLVDFKNVDPRYGKTQMQQLIDVGFVEGVERTGRYKDARGNDVLMDVDALQSVASADDGFGAPRLSPPMRLVHPSAALGGTVGVLFPYMNPRGEHGFPTPDPAKPFDLASLILNVMGTYLSSGGTNVSLEPCMERSSCAWIKPVPQ
jgi:hypothetical protein